MQPTVLGQQERRRRRALEEIKRVIPRLGQPVFTSFEVVSASRVRELTELPAGDPPSTPPPGKTVATLTTAVRELIETLERQVVAAQL